MRRRAVTDYIAAVNFVIDPTLGIIFVLRDHLKGADPAKESSVPGGQVKMRFTILQLVEENR